MDGRVEKWVNEHDGDELCKYCRYGYVCSHGVSGGPNAPIFPLCYDGDLKLFLDEMSLIEAIENGDEEVWMKNVAEHANTMLDQIFRYGCIFHAKVTGFVIMESRNTMRWKLNIRIFATIGREGNE